MGNVLRLCAFDNQQWLARSNGLPDGSYLCTLHMRQLFGAFDPQPNDVVRFMTKGYPGDWVVRARNDDTVVVRTLGFPEWPETITTVASLYPADVHSAIRRGIAAGVR